MRVQRPVIAQVVVPAIQGHHRLPGRLVKAISRNAF